MASGCTRVSFTGALVAELRSIALSGRGDDCRETGGILMGTAVGDELRLNACEEVPSEHRTGTEYKLGATDRVRLEEVLASRAGVEGFFRSCASPESEAEGAGEQFVKRYFPQGDCICLTIRSLSPEQCIATAHWFRDGRVLPLVENRPFALDPGQTPVLRIRPSLPTPARARREIVSRRSPRLWLPVMACLLLGIAAGAGYGFWSVEQHSSQAPPAAPAEVPPAVASSAAWTDLRLDAHPSDRDLAITWDAGAVRALHATGGVLTVTQGGASHEIQLSAAQVSAGHYRYPTTRSDTTVRLIVTAGGRGVASDSLRLASQAVPVTVPAPQVVETNSRVVAPASAVHEVQPDIPEGIRSRLSAEVVIPVEVQVSDRGRVLRAQVSDQGNDGVHRYLAEQAEKAAREWQFNPARTRSGAAVASSKTIEFVFRP